MCYIKVLDASSTCNPIMTF